MLVENTICERPRIGATDADGAMTLEFAWCHAGKKNQNGRIYKKETLAKAVSACQESILQGRAFGASYHPKGELSLDEISHIISRLWMERDTAMAQVKILPTTKGRNLAVVLKAGGAIGISSRGTGTVDEKTGIVNDDFKLAALDFVMSASNGTYATAADQIFESVKIPESREAEMAVADARIRYANSRIAGFRGDFESYLRIFKTKKG